MFFWIFGRLPLYIAQRFLLWVAVVVCVVGILFASIETIETAKRASQAALPLIDLFTIVLAKMPYSLIQLLPFSGLIAAMLCFQQLSQTQELVAMQNAGLAPRHFVLPVLLVALAIGCITITIVNPISTALLNQSDKLVYKYIKIQPSMLNISGAGIWFRDHADDDAPQRLVHTGRIDLNTMTLEDVLIIRFHANDRFAESIRAKTATLSGGRWHMQDVLITSKEHVLTPVLHYSIPTDTKISQLQEDLAMPENLSFWQLPGFISALKTSGFSALRHVVYWYSLLIFPLFLAALALLGASFSIYLPRLRLRSRSFALGLLTGFLVFFSTKLVHALGISGTISPFLAAIGPVIICLMAGGALLLHLEGN